MAPGSSQHVIKTAYSKRSKLLHPDCNLGDSPEEKETKKKELLLASHKPAARLASPPSPSPTTYKSVADLWIQVQNARKGLEELDDVKKDNSRSADKD